MAADSRRSGDSWPFGCICRELLFDEAEMVSFTDVVDEELEYGKVACGDDERTRLERRRPGMVVD
jgi:hypothetical protein